MDGEIPPLPAQPHPAGAKETCRSFTADIGTHRRDSMVINVRHRVETAEPV
jgi:hypothetical protein